jgi:hypothetical protein
MFVHIIYSSILAYLIQGGCMSLKINIARVGALAGWAAFAGILLFEVIGPQIVAGQRVSGTLDANIVLAYYRYSALQYFAPAVFLAALAFLVFAVALRETLSVNETARFLGKLGIAFTIIEVPLIIAKSALSATLVSIATYGGDIMPLFRFWDVLYNGGVYAVEAGVAVSFALAMQHVPGFPRWMPWFGLVTGALQLVNMLGLFIGIPDSLTLPGNITFAIWLVGANIGLSRLAWQTARLSTAQTS